MTKIYVIHENDAWVEPLRAAFEEQLLPHQEWFLAIASFLGRELKALYNPPLSIAKPR
jgi:hypothetical protein